MNNASCQPRKHLYLIKCNIFITTDRKIGVYCSKSVHLSFCYDSLKTFNLTCNLKSTQQTELIFFMHIPCWAKYFQTTSTLDYCLGPLDHDLGPLTSAVTARAMVFYKGTLLLLETFIARTNLFLADMKIMCIIMYFFLLTFISCIYINM